VATPKIAVNVKEEEKGEEGIRLRKAFYGAILIICLHDVPTRCASQTAWEGWVSLKMVGI
jgi:hypothetical protein